MNLEGQLLEGLKAARAAARKLALASTEQKDGALQKLARGLRESSAALIQTNQKDLTAAQAAGISGAFLDRLMLDPARVEAMAAGVEQVAALPDPAGETIARWTRPNGLEISQVRVPLGVIGIIYESRPNVTIDAAVLCLKAGNSVVLRGGSEALHTNGALARLLGQALERSGLEPASVMFIDNPDRAAIQIMKRHPELLDLIIPRGGASLKAVLQDSAVPILPHFDGICHTYVDRGADLQMAEEICFNAKCSRPSVCNAMETLLVHRAIAHEFLSRIGRRMAEAGVEFRGDAAVREILTAAKPAAEADWDTEYLELILAVKIVDSLDEAIAFIARHGSGLADAIVTDDRATAERFQREVDSATVYVNASTRFTDGFEFGFGAETGISTNRLHARGPMGLRELTTYKYVIQGNGQIRV